MKRLILFIFTLACFACDDGDPIRIEKVEKSVTVASADTLEFHLSEGIPVEGGYSITEQAEHYDTSEIQHRENGLFYIYVSAEGFTGEDLVKIKREDSDGSKVYAETITTLKIKVTE